MLQPSNKLAAAIQLLLPLGIYWGIQLGVAWYWWASSFVWWILYVVYGNNVALHRYFTHSQFKVGPIRELFLLWIGSTIGVGGPLSFAMTHLVHHKYPDTELDPHGPIRGRRSWLMCFQKTVNPEETPLFSKRMVELNRKYKWVHDYYLIILLVNAGIFYAIDPRVFVFFWLIPASAACWAIGLGVWRQHYGMTAVNLPWARWQIFDEGLHLNHHLHPAAPNCAVNPGEIDWAYQASRLLRPTYNWQGQPTRDRV